MKSFANYLSIILCFVVAALLWIANARMDDFQSYHLAIAREATSSSANEIARFVAEKKRLVNIFASEESALIGKLAESPEDEALHATLRERIALFFPDFFSFTVTNAAGTPYMHDFDGFIGELCRTDLTTFASTKTQHPRVHPHAEAYHFDILAPFSNNGRSGILFVSFHADILGDVLRASQTPGHQLLLIHPEASELIEASATGARNRLQREDFRLTEQERARILYRKQVPQTAWEVLELHQPGLLNEYRRKLVLHSAITLLLLSTISLFSLLMLRREERLRKSAEAHKDEFLAVVSHELRTPLTSIRGSLGLIAGGATGAISEKTRELADVAIRNCERLSELVGDILDLRKIEAGEFSIHRKPYDLVELVKQSIDANKGYANEFDVSFALCAAPNELCVELDAKRIQQVMANLLSNAAKYGRKNDNIEITINAHPHFARVSVTDHGTGVPGEFRERIFRKFAQHDASSIRKVGGTGLGLSIVKHIVELHGGHVGLETATGNGSTFYFDLPLQPAPVSAPQNRDPAIQVEQTGQ